MSVNSSSSSSTSSGSRLHLNLSSVTSSDFYSMNCFISGPGPLVFATFAVTNTLLLLPLCVLVLHLGLQRWRRRQQQQQRSTSAAATTSHSDSFAYHLVVMELLNVFGCIFCCCAIYWAHVRTIFVAYCLASFSWYGQSFFHMLTCVERYLAVLHPITYLGLRGGRGIRIRNIFSGCVWLLSIVGTCLMALDGVSVIVDFCILVFCLIVISFFSLSVLCTLTRPGPGEQGRVRVDQSKRRAFYTIMAILGVLLLRCFWALAGLVFHIVEQNDKCVLLVSDFWLNLPCSLILPLLFLHRACCQNPKGG